MSNFSSERCGDSFRNGAVLGQSSISGERRSLSYSRVIGPDEYHECVDDNAYTNGLACWNLRTAADLQPGSPSVGPTVGLSCDSTSIWTIE